MVDFKKGDILVKVFSDGSHAVFSLECMRWADGHDWFGGIDSGGYYRAFYGSVRFATKEERHWFLLRNTENWVGNEIQAWER